MVIAWRQQRCGGERNRSERAQQRRWAIIIARVSHRIIRVPHRIIVIMPIWVMPRVIGVWVPVIVMPAIGRMVIPVVVIMPRIGVGDR